MLNTIIKLDKIDMHLNKEQILIMFSDCSYPFDAFENLLDSGEIFEIEGLIYPTGTKHNFSNHFEELKTEHIDEEGGEV